MLDRLLPKYQALCQLSSPSAQIRQESIYFMLTRNEGVREQISSCSSSRAMFSSEVIANVISSDNFSSSIYIISIEVDQLVSHAVLSALITSIKQWCPSNDIFSAVIQFFQCVCRNIIFCFDKYFVTCNGNAAIRSNSNDW